MSYDYWYDAQIPRFLQQVVRAFSGFSYRPGMVSGTESPLIVVPARMAVRDKLVASIMMNNSQNALLTAPMISVNLTGVAMARERLQAPSYTRELTVVERGIDRVTGLYTNQPGNSYTVESLMPLPLDLTLDVDIWTSNWSQKFQLLEQMFVVFYPDISIQNSDNPLDWTALTTMMMEDFILSNRSIPIGSSDEIEIMTFKFKLPMLLSPPSKVKRQNIIEQIITNLGSTTDILDDPFGNTTSIGRVMTTPGDHAIFVADGQIKLLGSKGSEMDEHGLPYSWQTLLNQYGEMRQGISQMLLKTNEDMDDPTGVFGTIQFTSDPSILSWQVNPSTLPANTLTAVNQVINPQDQGPGFNLPSVVDGQRYLILNDMGASQMWGNVTAKNGDIIQFTNDRWVVSQFDKSKLHYVLNRSTGKQLHWDSTAKQWGIAVEGEYSTGMWRVNL